MPCSTCLRCSSTGDVRLLLEVRLAHLGVGLAPARALLGEDLAGDLGDVGALVPLGLEGDVVAAQLEIPRRDGLREDVHLHAGVVDVELPLDAPARVLEHARHAVAERRPAAVADVHRPHRVRRDELDLHALALARASTRPKSRPCSRASVSTRWSAWGDRRMLMKPGPAISSAAMSGWPAMRAVTISATARGFIPASLALRKATVVAQSPLATSRGRSSAGSGISASWSSPASTAARTASATSWEMASLTWVLAFRDTGR